jgi:hypothetical protein
MKVKDFANRLKTNNGYLTLMQHDDKIDTVFTDTDLRAMLLKSMPSSWQNAYLLKGTQNTDDSQKMLSYFVQLQSITDNQLLLELLQFLKV